MMEMLCTLMSRYGNQCFLWREVETVDETHKHLRQSRLGIPLDCRQVPKHVTTKTSDKLLLNSDPPPRRPHNRVLKQLLPSDDTIPSPSM